MAFMKPGIKKPSYYRYIDTEMQELIVIQHALGFQTISSCAGHQKGTSHKEELAHIKKQCEERDIPFDESTHDNFYFHIFYYMPESRKIKKLKEIYEAAKTKMAVKLSPEKISGFVLSKEKSTTGNRYVALLVDNNTLWSNDDYAILRQELTYASRERIKDSALEKKIRQTYERIKKLR